jgi:hypothetical protein
MCPLSAHCPQGVRTVSAILSAVSAVCPRKSVRSPQTCPHCPPLSAQRVAGVCLSLQANPETTCHPHQQTSMPEMPTDSTPTPIHRTLSDFLRQKYPTRLQSLRNGRSMQRTTSRARHRTIRSQLLRRKEGMLLGAKYRLFRKGRSSLFHGSDRFTRKTTTHLVR